ncbi:hypothetical protein LL250_12065 [Halomonas meridiana]|nr:hypothetical protein [Halomonas meridiana]
MSDAQKRIAELEYLLARQAKAAQQGMDAAKKHGSHVESEAKRLHAECNPEALESERETNAKLTELVAELERDRNMHKAAEEAQIALRQKADEREAALAAHVERLIAAGDKLREPWDLDTILGAETRRRVEGWDKARAETLTTNLARRDALKQAEALEVVAAMIKSDATNAMHGYAMHRTASIALSNAALARQQAEAPQ